MPLRTAGALLVGAGGAGAATMLGLALGDVVGGLGDAGRLGLLAFALLLSGAVAAGLVGLLRRGSGATQRMRSFAALGTLLWLSGLGLDVYVPDQAPSVLLAAHTLGAVGGLALAAAGWLARPFEGLQR